MDTKFNEEVGSDIHSHRLRTARQKKWAAKEAQKKLLLGLHKERMELQHQQQNLGYVALIPPIVKGWKRYFVLRDDVARSKDAAFYQNILDKINKVEYCSRKDFRRKVRYVRKKKEWKLIAQNCSTTRTH